MQILILRQFILILVWVSFQVQLASSAFAAPVITSPAANDPAYSTENTVHAANESYFLASITSPNAPANSNGIAPNTKPTATATVIAFPATGAANSSPGYLDKLRQEIKKLQIEHATQNQNVSWFKKTNLEFAPQSLAFFLAHGMIISSEAWLASDGDPLKMEKHILSLKDPVAQLSMYTFMQATGFYVHFNAKKLGANIDDLTRARMMRRFSYQGLAFGSIVSALTADIFAPVATCLKAKFNSDKRFIKKYDEECVVSLTHSWSSWTWQKKINQYAPQIFTAVVTQAVSELIHIGSVSLGQGIANLGKAATKKISWQSLASLAVKKEFFTVRKIAVNIAGLITPGVGEAKIFKFIGQIIMATNFIGVSDVLTPYIYRPFNNLLLPFEFQFEANKMNQLLNRANHFNWDTDNINLARQKIEANKEAERASKSAKKIKELNYEEIQNSGTLLGLNENYTFEGIDKEIDNFTEVAQAWKAHLNMHNEQSLTNWLEFSTKILNQISLAKMFYTNYIQSFYNSLSIGHQIKTGATTAENKFNNNYFPFRLFPLYGVGFLQSTFDKNKTEDSSEKPPLISNLYLDTPQHMEKYQLKTIAYAVKKIKELMAKASNSTSKKLNISTQAENVFKTIIDMLESDNIDTIAQGLIKINTILEIYGTPSKEYQFKNNDPVFFELVNLLRQMIGNPYPILVQGAGFSQAFNVHSTTKEISTNAAYPLTGPTYHFNKDADYLTYQMICGPSIGKLTENQLMSDNFLPPSILREGSKPLQLCNSHSTLVRSENLYSMQLNNAKEVNNKSLRESKNFNITSYLVEFFDYNAFGDFRSSPPEVEAWWLDNVEKGTKPRLSKMDEDYARLVTKVQDTLYGTSYGADTTLSTVGYALTKASDWLNFSKYLPKNIELTLKWQLEFYLIILQSIYDNSMSEANQKKQLNYLEIARNNAEFSNKHQDIFIKKSQLIDNLHKAFDEYFLQMRPDAQLNLDDYVKLSEKITNQINEVKIQYGLAERDNEKSTETTTILLPLDEKKSNAFNLKQKAALSAINGLVLLEADIKRFIFFKIQLSSSLNIEIELYNKIMTSTNKDKKPKNQGYIPGQSF